VFAAFHPIADNRIRESVGLAFEDFAVGQVFHHRPGVTVTQQDNVNEAYPSAHSTAICLQVGNQWGGAAAYGTMRLLVAHTPGQQVFDAGGLVVWLASEGAQSSLSSRPAINRMVKYTASE